MVRRGWDIHLSLAWHGMAPRAAPYGACQLPTSLRIPPRVANMTRHGRPPASHFLGEQSYSLNWASWASREKAIDGQVM